MTLPEGWFKTEGSILLPQSIWLNLEIQCYRTFVDAKSLCQLKKQLGVLT